jgi:hypothetical protein
MFLAFSLAASSVSDAGTPSPTGTTAGSSSLGNTPGSTQFEGSFDKLEAASVGGWAWDKTQPDTPIKVDIYDGTVLLGTVLANGYREDLKNAGKGDGKHAFNYAMPPTLRDGQSHTISVRFAGPSTELIGSPKTLLFPKL